MPFVKFAYIRKEKSFDQLNFQVITTLLRLYYISFCKNASTFLKKNCFFSVFFFNLQLCHILEFFFLLPSLPCQFHLPVYSLFCKCSIKHRAFCHCQTLLLSAMIKSQTQGGDCNRGLSDFLFGRNHHFYFSLPAAHAATISLLFCR